MARTFVDWTRPALPAAAEALVAAHMPDDARDRGPRPLADLSGHTVVVPGARAGRRLTELLLDEAERRGAALLPPHTVTVGTLPALLHTPRHPPASRPVRLLVWARALQAGPRELLSTLFARLPGPDEPLPAWRGLAREVAALARTVAAEGLTFDDVAARCAGGGAGFDDAPRWRLLARLQADVRRRLDALELVDAETERMAALAEGRVRLPGPLWLVGVAEMPGLTAAMLRAADAAAAGDRGGPRVHALIHAPAERADGFDELGLLRSEAWLDARPPLDDDAVVVVDGPADEAETAARLLAEQARGRRTDEVVLGVPRTELVPWLAERLERDGVRVRDARGTPMRHSGPWRLLAALAEVVRERTPDAVAALVRHPDLTPWLRRQLERPADDPGADLVAALDRWRATHLPARMVAPYPGARIAGRDGADARLVEALMGALDAHLLQGLGGGAPLSSHMAPALAALDAVYGSAARDEATPTGRRIVRALRVLERGAATLAAVPADLDVACDGATALALLLDETASTPLAERGDEGAVELLGWLELHLDDTPVAVVTGLNEGSVPESVRGDPFLPDGLRRHLGLPDNRTRLARDLYRLSAMVHSRPVLRLVAGRRSAEGDPLRPSRLLFAADDDTVARRVRRFYGVDEPLAPAADSGGDGAPTGDDPGAPADDDAGRPQRREPTPSPASAFVLPPEPVLHLDPFPATLSPTDFRGLLDDPYRWALRRLRGPNGAAWPPLEPTDDHALELDGAAFGDLAHVVLERFGQEERARHARGEAGTDPWPLADRLNELLDEVAGVRFGRTPRVAVRLQLEQLRLRLRAFARWHAGWVGEGWRVRAVEARTRAAGVPLGSEPPVGLSGKIDRIDHHPERGWAVLDYKTADAGPDPTKTHVKGGTRGLKGADTEWRDLQLPLYHWMAPRIDGLPVSGADPAEVAVGYVLLPRDTAATGAVLADWSPEVLAAGVATARRLVADLAAGPVHWDADRRPGYPDDPRLAALLGLSVLGGEAAGDDDDDDEDGGTA